MERGMKDCGPTTRPMAKERSGTSMEISMTVNGSTIRHMVLAPIPMQTELGTKGIGKTICSMDGVLSNGLMAASTKVTIKLVASTDRVAICGQMDRSTPGNGLKTKSTVAAVMNGWTEEPTKEIGLKIIWMVLVPTHGQTVVSTLVSTTKTASMVKVLIRGQTAANMKGNGKMAGNTAKARTSQIQWKSLARGSGSRVNGRNGFEQLL
jgi:hypothetical protein